MMDDTDWPLIGHGFDRICYQNPADPTRCVKIVLHSHFRQTLREIVYFTHLINRNLPFDHLPEFYGEIRGDNNESIGIEQELIYDVPPRSTDTSVKYNGMPVKASRTIRAYLLEPLSPEQIEEFRKALDELKSYLLRYNILALDTNHNNVVVQHIGNGIKMVLIDGVYNTEWIPVSEYFPFLGKRKILRRWNRFMETLCKQYSPIIRTEVT